MAYNGDAYCVICICMYTNMRFFYSIKIKDQMEDALLQLRSWRPVGDTEYIF